MVFKLKKIFQGFITQNCISTQGITVFQDKIYSDLKNYRKFTSLKKISVHFGTLRKLQLFPS